MCDQNSLSKCKTKENILSNPQTTDQNYFIFMGFSRMLGKIMSPLPMEIPTSDNMCFHVSLIHLNSRKW